MGTGFRAMTKMALASVALVSGTAAYADGAATYRSRCAMCHKPDGAGVVGAFPRLTGRVAKIAASAEGRSFLAKVLLYGVSGPITVDGKTITSLMPGHGTLSDQDAADLLNHIVGLPGKPASAFKAGDVTKLRATRMTGAQVGAERKVLAGKGLIP